MNNHRLLTGLLVATLSGYGVCASGHDRKVMTLDELYRIAETHSTQLRPSLTSEEVAAKETEIARSHRLPEIEANLSLNFLGDGFTVKRNFSDYTRAPIPHFGNTLGININQPLYSGGAITAGIEIAELKSSAIRHVTELNRNNIRFRLTGYYLNIFKMHNLREVAEGNLQRARKMLDEMKARYEQGIALHNDIIRYELLISDLELQIVKIDNTLSILNRNLAVTAGMNESTEILPDTSLLAKSLPISSEQWWQQEAESVSPTLKLAQSEVAISKKAETLAKSTRLPKIGLQAGWSLDGPILVEVPPINRNLSYWYVGIGVSYNLSSLYKNDKSIVRSRIATRLANEQLDVAKENLRLEINSVYTRYMEAYEELKTQKKSVELANSNYNTISTRYAEGMALITDLLDAANSQLEAEQKLVNAHINIIYYYYKLLFTSGKI